MKNDGVSTGYLLSGGKMEPNQRARVLVVENDPVTRADTIRNLRIWTYDTYAAESHGEDLIQNALHLARQHRCQVALVDMRLCDDHDLSDVSGLKLVEQLAPVPVLVVSSYGSLQKASQAIGGSGAAAFIGKEEGPRRLRESLNDTTQHLLALLNEYDVKLKPPLNMRDLALQLGFEDNQGLGEELTLLSSQLFPEVKTLELEMMPSGKRRHNRSLFIAHLSSKERFLIKLAPIELVQKEQARYEHFLSIDGFKPYIQRLRFGYAWNLGGIIYLLPGSTMEEITTLAHFYQEGALDQINLVVRNAYADWAETYSLPQLLEQPLVDAYLSSMPPSIPESTTDINSLAFASHLVSDLPVPDIWIASHRHESRIPGTLSAVTHGAFVSDNLLIDMQSEKAYVADYSSFGQGHILRDFCTLEADILLRLADLSDRHLYEMAVALTRSREIGEPLQITERLFRHKGARKAFDIVANLRKLCMEMTRYGDLREYYWALLLSVMNLASIVGYTDSLQAQMRLFAGIICGRLEHWEDGGWPVSTWPPVEWIDGQKRLRYEAEIRSLQRDLFLYEQQMAPYKANQASSSLVEERNRVLAELSEFGEFPRQRRSKD